ncbi:MAG: G1 family glutamic endopeptidase, partial [Candidatus Dormibacteria bacterium]
MSTPSPQTRRAPARQRAGVDPATPSLRDVAPVTHLFRFVPGPVRLRGTARRLALVAALASLVTGGLATAAAPALAAAAAPPTVRHQPMIRVVPQAPTRTLNGEVLTYNWSGYALDEGTYTGVSACWDVPAVPVTPLDTYSSAWVGIGGFSGGDTTLIQTGTTEESYQGQVYYFAWTELLPAEPALLFAVTPGDTVCASIAEQSANVWGIAIQDKTGGGSYSSTTIDYTSSESSAEWIMERPELCTGPLPADCTLSTLADYGELTFTAATVNGGNPELTSADGIFMYSDADQLISTPSTPNSSGNGFNVAYGPVAPLAPLGQAGTAGAYTPLKPFRLCDTRSAASVGYTTECTAHGALAAGSTMTF